jgi:hypothetical protein
MLMQGACHRPPDSATGKTPESARRNAGKFGIAKLFPLPHSFPVGAKDRCFVLNFRKHRLI